ncbi:MAG TPA: Smr/MutS family protein, partial [Candidatus Eisenbacteria bacterium]
MMDRHSLDVLEFPRVLAQAVRHAASERGAEWIAALEPTPDAPIAAARLDLTDELRRLITSADGFPPLDTPDVRRALGTLGAAGSVLDVPELRDLARLCLGARRVRERLAKEAEHYPLAFALSGRLTPAPHFERAVADTFDEHGEILDSASGALRTIRRHLKQQREKITSRLDSYRKGDDAERTITLRADRYVLAVKAGEKGEIGGIVHDRSGSGATVYLEPTALFEENNRLIELLVEERDEIRRILAALSDMVRGLREPLGVNAEVLAEFDAHKAMARLAESQNAMRPALATDSITLRAFRHPLLGDARNGEAPREVVPLDLELTPDARMLLITGPNMGGKTVALKGVGLACLMAAVGMHLPAGDGTEVVILADVVADIGDEQSIEQDLSTFASHLKRWVEAANATALPRLALLDEIGAGTDPAEGAALARAVLERLAAGGGFTVATTHLGALKTFAIDQPGVVNGSMRFDPVHEKPLYRLDQGLPGQSRAIEMARRLGLDSALTDRALELVGREERSVQALLSELEGTRRELEAEMARAREETARIQEEHARVDDVRRKYEERLKKHAGEYAAVKARAGREAQRHLDKAVDLLKEAETEARGIRQKALIESKEGQKRVENLKEAIKEAREVAPVVRSVAVTAPGRPIDATEVRIGNRFWAEPLAAWVTVVAPPDGTKVRVERNGLKVELPINALRGGVGAEGAAPAHRTALDELPDDPSGRPKGGFHYAMRDDIKAEVDLRGLTAEEAIDRLDHFLDESMLGAVPKIRVIHGKGT